MTHVTITRLGPPERITRVGGLVVSRVGASVSILRANADVVIWRPRTQVLISRGVHGDKGASGIVVSATPPADHSVLWVDTSTP